jgi:hypothetical protein
MIVFITEDFSQMNMRVLVLAVVVLSITAFAQTLPAPDPFVNPAGGASAASGVFQLKYFNINYGSGQIIVSNAGTVAADNDTSDDSAGTLCANFYSFDPNEEMQTCCSCPVTPNGLKSLSVNDDIIAKNLIVNPSTAITVKVLFNSRAANNKKCDAANVPLATLARGGILWGTNLRNVTFQGSPPTTVNAVTETEFSKAELSATELSKLVTYCQYVQILGSKVKGICAACQTGARGAIGQ